MRRKRVRWLVAVLLILGIALAALWWFYLRPPYGITKRSFGKIQAGMTVEEVERIIGVPCDNVGGQAQDVIWEGPLPKGVNFDFESIENWTAPDRGIRVFLDANRVVLYKDYWGPDEQDFLSRMLEMFGL